MAGSHTQFRIPIALGALLLWNALALALPPQGYPPERLLDADPQAVTWEALQRRVEHVEQNYQRYHNVYGVTWPGWRYDLDAPAPTHYESGGDSAIFTGFYLAGAVYRFLVTEDPADLDKVLDTLGGVYLLTHVSGTPGVLVRCAFPAAEAERYRYPGHWEFRLKEGYVYNTPPEFALRNIVNPALVYPPMIYFARTSRDQLTGVLFGLGAVWAELRPEGFEDRPELWRNIRWAREIAAYLAETLWRRLEATDFEIRDHNGLSGISAYRVTGSLRLQLAALHRAVAREGSSQAAYAYADAFYRATWRKVFVFGRMGAPSDLVNRFNNLNEYYAWNLRFARAYTVWLLEPRPKRRHVLAAYVRRKLWAHVESHRNAHFTFLYNAMAGTADARMEAGVMALKELALRSQWMAPSPLAGQDMRPNALRLLFGDVEHDVVPAHLRSPAHYFQWEKDPFTVGDGVYPDEHRASAMVGLMLPYWLGRYYGFLPGAGTKPGQSL